MGITNFYEGLVALLSNHAKVEEALSKLYKDAKKNKCSLHAYATVIDTTGTGTAAEAHAAQIVLAMARDGHEPDREAAAQQLFAGPIKLAAPNAGRLYTHCKDHGLIINIDVQGLLYRLASRARGMTAQATRAGTGAGVGAGAGAGAEVGTQAPRDTITIGEVVAALKGYVSAELAKRVASIHGRTGGKVPTDMPDEQDATPVPPTIIVLHDDSGKYAPPNKVETTDKRNTATAKRLERTGGPAFDVEPLRRALARTKDRDVCTRDELAQLMNISVPGSDVGWASLCRTPKVSKMLMARMMNVVLDTLELPHNTELWVNVGGRFHTATSMDQGPSAARRVSRDSRILPGDAAILGEGDHKAPAFVLEAWDALQRRCKGTPVSAIVVSDDSDTVLHLAMMLCTRGTPRAGGDEEASGQPLRRLMNVYQVLAPTSGFLGKAGLRRIISVHDMLNALEACRFAVARHIPTTRNALDRRAANIQDVMCLSAMAIATGGNDYLVHTKLPTTFPTLAKWYKAFLASPEDTLATLPAPLVMVEEASEDACVHPSVSYACFQAFCRLLGKQKRSQVAPRSREHATTTIKQLVWCLKYCAQGLAPPYPDPTETITVHSADTDFRAHASFYGWTKEAGNRSVILCCAADDPSLYINGAVVDNTTRTITLPRGHPWHGKDLTKPFDKAAWKLADKADRAAFKAAVATPRKPRKPAKATTKTTTTTKGPVPKKRKRKSSVATTAAATAAATTGPSTPAPTRAQYDDKVSLAMYKPGLKKPYRTCVVRCSRVAHVLETYFRGPTNVPSMVVKVLHARHMKEDGQCGAVWQDRASNTVVFMGVDDVDTYEFWRTAQDVAVESGATPRASRAPKVPPPVRRKKQRTQSKSKDKDKDKNKGTQCARALFPDKPNKDLVPADEAMHLIHWGAPTAGNALPPTPTPSPSPTPEPCNFLTDANAWAYTPQRYDRIAKHYKLPPRTAWTQRKEDSGWGSACYTDLTKKTGHDFLAKTRGAPPFSVVGTAMRVVSNDPTMAPALKRRVFREITESWFTWSDAPKSTT